MNIKMIRFAIALILASFTTIVHAQSIVIQSNIRLPQDTALRALLINSLNGFLGQKEMPNKENKFVLKEDLLETSDLLDEMKGMERKRQRKDFFKPYLNNVVELDGNNFIIQLSYLGIVDNAPRYACQL